MAPYQEFKLFLVDTFSLPKDSFHLLLGTMAYLAAAIFFRIPLSAKRALIAPVLFALALEVADARDSVAIGRPVPWFDSGHDLIFTTIVPVLVWATIRFGKVDKREGN